MPGKKCESAEPTGESSQAFSADRGECQERGCRGYRGVAHHCAARGPAGIAHGGPEPGAGRPPPFLAALRA